MLGSYREFDNFANSDGAFKGGTQILKNISSDVQLFNKNVSVLERKIGLLDSQQDDSMLQQEIIELVGDTVQLAKMARTSIDKGKDQMRSLSHPERIQFDRLVSTFKNSVSKFLPIQQSTSNLERDMLSKAKSASLRKELPDSLPESDRVSSGVHHYQPVDRDFHSQKQVQLQEDNVLILEQREREMHQLEHDIVDINDIFRDLGTMVNDQGDVLDNIESNVQVTAVRVEDGTKQLERAVRHKKCSRKMTLCIVCMVSGIVIALIIVPIILICTVRDYCQ